MNETPYIGPDRREVIDRREDRIATIEKLATISVSVADIFVDTAKQIELEAVISGQRASQLKEREDTSSDISLQESAEVRRDSEIAKAKSELLRDLYLKITEVTEN